MSLLFSGTIELLSDTLSGLSWRQRVLANNIANAETPGFRGSEVRFEELLLRRAEPPPEGEPTRADTRHFLLTGPLPFAPEVVTVPTPAVRPDGNNVDMEREMGQLLQNELSYNAAAQMLTRKLAELRLVIAEGR